MASCGRWQPPCRDWFDLMYLFETMDNQGNGKIYPDLVKATPDIVVKVNP